MELTVWKGDWGLPSIDSSCLEVMAYAKFSGAPLKVNETSTPWSVLPSLKHGPSNKLTKFSDIAAYLRKQNYSADIDLTPQQISDIKAYSALLRHKLQPALLYLWWVDAKNYTEFTRPWYAKTLAFPLNYFLPGMMQRTASKVVQSKVEQLDLQDSQVENVLLKDAQECLTVLSQRLGKSLFFFGNSPTSLDAIIFGNLAPLLKAPFPSAALQNHLKACDNLSTFISRILQQYFPTPLTDSNANRKQDSSLSDFTFTWTNAIFTTAFAATAMVTYALASGLVKIEVQEHWDDDSGTEDDDKTD